MQEIQHSGTSGIAVINCDVLILGGGPAGLTAAIYAARSKLNTVVIESALTGGQVAATYTVSNYPGTDGTVKGLDLMENMKKQALEFGVHIHELTEVVDLDLENEHKIIWTKKNQYCAKAVIIATGAEPRKLPVDKEEAYRGRGIHYCATCDGPLYQDADLVVVGGGISAVEEGLFLTRYGKSVTLVVRSDKLKAPASEVEELMLNPLVTVRWNTTVESVEGEGFVSAITVKDHKSGMIEALPVEGLFVYIGMVPNTAILEGKLPLTPSKTIETSHSMETTIPGVFACGDVREKDIRQISTAVGDGTIAGVMAERYISILQATHRQKAGDTNNGALHAG